MCKNVGWVQLCLHVNVPLFVVYSSFLANRPIVVSAATHTHIYISSLRKKKEKKKGTSWKNKEADRLSGTREKWLCLLISMARVYSKMGGEKRRALNDSEKNEVDQRNSVTPVGLTKNEKGFGNFSLRPNSIFHSWRGLIDMFMFLGCLWAYSALIKIGFINFALFCNPRR